MESRVQPKPFDLMRQLADPVHVANPYPLYELIRAGTAVELPTGELAFARHSDVATIVKDPRFGKPPQPNVPFGPARTLFRMPLLLDPPDHTRLRRVVAPLFLPAATAEWSDTIERCSERLLPPDATEIDLVADYSHELPLAVISTMLAVPDEDRAQVARWSRTLTEAVDAPPPANIRDIGRAARQIATRRAKPIHAIRSSARIVRYAKQHIDLHRSAPPTLLIEALVRARHDGELDDDEAAAIWIMLLIAGHETTANLISLSALALLDHHDVLDEVTNHPNANNRLVDECLRYTSPVAFTPRIALDDLDLGGVHVERGRIVLALFAAANRDPSVFPHPDRLDLTRPTAPPHLGFGGGIHFCLGSALARIETQTALHALALRLENSQPRVTWGHSTSLRGPTRALVRLNEVRGPDLGAPCAAT